MIRSVSDSFMMPKNPRIGVSARYRRSQTCSPATFKYGDVTSQVQSSASDPNQPLIIDDTNDEPLIRNRKEFMILVGLAYLYMNANIGFSILAPFLPLEVKKKKYLFKNVNKIFKIPPK